MMNKRNSTIASPSKYSAAPKPKFVKRKNPLSRRDKEASQTAPRFVSSEERHRMIAEMAYFIAERRGFAAGHAFEDWLQAEAEINHRLG